MRTVTSNLSLKRSDIVSKKAKKEECIVTEVVLVTPAMATEWMKKNIRNRRLTPSKVNRFAEMIKEGMWQTTHQGVAFYDNDELADGQHRLAAIIAANKPVHCMVSYGLTPESNAAIDTGVPRTLAHNMQFLGYAITREQSAAYRVLFYEYRRQERKSAAWMESDRPEPQEFEKLYLGLQEGVEFSTSCKVFPKILAHSCVRGAIGAAYYSRDKDRLSEFVKVFGSGVAEKTTDTAAIRLREYLLTTELSKSTLGKQDIYGRVCTAITAFLEFRGLSKLYCRQESAFKLPKIQGL